MRILLGVFILGLMAQSSFVHANSFEEFQERWAMANYELEDEAQTEEFESLIADINLKTESESSAELLIWKGIIESSYAGKVGGMTALKLVKSAKASLEQAMSMDPGALHGSAFTSLGALYYQVPPWPIAFGSNKKARKYLEQALELNPDGIDPNFFYGAFLMKEKEYAAAKSALQKAMQAPDRPERPVADRGRRAEVRDLLDQLAGERKK